MTTARVFSGLLSNLVTADGVAAATLTHTFRDRERTTPIQISADVLVKIESLAEGAVALYGALNDGVLTVLGPDLRLRTLAAARPRGEMGPPAPQAFTGEITSYGRRISQATGKLYVKGEIRLANDTVKTFLVRDNALAEAFAETLVQYKTFDTDLIGVLMGDTLEVIGVPTPTAKPAKRMLSRDQKDARNARARARRAEKKGPVNG